MCDLAARIDALSERVAALEHAQSIAGPEVSELNDLAAIEALGRWIRHMDLDTDTLVSVVLPTCDRPLQLARAISSVLAQRYRHLELLVVQDGDCGEITPVIEAADDPRIQISEWGGRRTCWPLSTWTRVRPSCAGVERTDRHYRRDRLDALPDLLLEWNHDRPVETIWSPRFGLAHGVYSQWRTGDVDR
jgi:hypothetical protein